MYSSAYPSNGKGQEAKGLKSTSRESPIKILLTGRDESLSHHVLKRIAIQRPYWQWSTAFDLKHCFPTLLRNLPDVIIVDCLNSVPEELHLFEIYSQNPILRSIPLILLMDLPPDEDCFPPSFSLESVDFLTKPYFAPELVTRIEHLVTRQEAQQTRLLSLEQKEKRITNHELELQAYKNEIAKLNLLLDQKNKELGLFHQQIEQARSELRNSDSRLMLKRIASNIEQAIHSEMHWEMLSTRINHLNDGFLRRLAEFHPNLTRGEREFCSLLRLNLSTKEAARILSISPGSILKKRMRLKKRLGLEKKCTLESYVQSL